VYWEPHLAELEAARRAARINREFAAHFRPPGVIRRLILRWSGLDRVPAVNLDETPAEIASPAPAAKTGAAQRELLPGGGPSGRVAPMRSARSADGSRFPLVRALGLGRAGVRTRLDATGEMRNTSFVAIR